MGAVHLNSDSNIFFSLDLLRVEQYTLYVHLIGNGDVDANVTMLCGKLYLHCQCERV